MSNFDYKNTNNITQINKNDEITSEKRFIDTLNINYKREYKLNKSGLGQIICALDNVGIRKEKKKKYEEILAQFFDDKIPYVIEAYEDLLRNSIDQDNQDDYNMRHYNLTKRLPKNIVIEEQKHNIILGKANVGNLIEALLNRITYIIERDMPKIYEKEDCNVGYWKKFQEDLVKFREIIKEFEEEFKKIIDVAHKKQHQFDKKKRYEQFKKKKSKATKKNN